jgi:N-acetylglutamate synthase-like GNAT family acetyltransferase
MADDLQIRRAHAEDAATISAVLYESFVEFKPLYTEGGFAATALQEHQVRARIEEGPVWIAVRADVVVGTVAAVITAKSVYIRGMAVVPSARGSGAGTALLRQTERWARSEGCTHLFLSTTPFLNSAIRLYEKFGFRRMNADVQDLFGTPLFTLEKNI